MITAETKLEGRDVTVLHTAFYLPNGDGIVVYRDGAGMLSDRGGLATYLYQRPLRLTKRRAALVAKLAEVNDCKFDAKTWNISGTQDELPGIITTILQAAAMLRCAVQQ